MPREGGGGNLEVILVRMSAPEFQNQPYLYMSRGMRFPTMWYVRPAKSQISLRIRAV